jgi:hypothetical protein
VLRDQTLTDTCARVGLRTPASSPAAAMWYREETLEEGLEDWEILVGFDQSGTQGEA